jgi:hypothetical protein
VTWTCCGKTNEISYLTNGIHLDSFFFKTNIPEKENILRFFFYIIPKWKVNYVSSKSSGELKSSPYKKKLPNWETYVLAVVKNMSSIFNIKRTAFCQIEKILITTTVLITLTTKYLNNYVWKYSSRMGLSRQR